MRRFSESVEDYLEAIYLIKRKKGRVRTSDLASFLGCRPPSVTEMLGKLRRMGLVRHERYGEVSLTAEGKRVAREVSGRHEALIGFLEFLGVDRKTAEVDACRIEHAVSGKTMERLKRLVEFVQSEPGEEEWVRRCRRFLEAGGPAARPKGYSSS